MAPYQVFTPDLSRAPNACCHLSDTSWLLAVSCGRDHLGYLAEEHGRAGVERSQASSLCFVRGDFSEAPTQPRPRQVAPPTPVPSLW